MRTARQSDAYPRTLAPARGRYAVHAHDRNGRRKPGDAVFNLYSYTVNKSDAPELVAKERALYAMV